MSLVTSSVSARMLRLEKCCFNSNSSKHMFVMLIIFWTSRKKVWTEMCTLRLLTYMRRIVEWKSEHFRLISVPEPVPESSVFPLHYSGLIYFHHWLLLTFPHAWIWIYCKGKASLSVHSADRLKGFLSSIELTDQVCSNPEGCAATQADVKLTRWCRDSCCIHKQLWAG